MAPAATIAARDSAIEGRAATAGTRRLLRPLLMIGGVVVVAVAAMYFWLTGGRYVSIDDAYMRAAKVAV